MKSSPLAHAISLALVSSVLHSNYANANYEPEKIEKIVVTGQKIDRSLQETATSVAVVTSKNIEQQNIGDLFDVLERIPNVNGNLGSDFSIRGIDAFNVSGGGNSFLASVYVDGAALPSRMIQQGGFSTWDVAQVEVLRGPQSTLQGRNALAGAIVMSTKAPSYEWDGKLRLGYGEYGHREAAVAFGGELIDNQMAFRLSAEQTDLDGFKTNITRNKTSDFLSNDTYRAKFLIEPEAVPALSINIGITHNKNTMGVLWTDNNLLPEHPNAVALDVKTHEFMENDIFTVQFDYEINDIWSFSAITAYSDSDYGYLWDGDTTAKPESTLDYTRSDITFSEEIRLVYQYDDFSGVFGAYYSDLEVDGIQQGQRSLDLVQLGVPTLLVSPQEYGGLGLPQDYANYILSLYQDANPLKLGTMNDAYQKVTNRALFFDATYSFNEQWELIAGLRWDREEQENKADTLYSIDNAAQLPNPATDGLDPTTAMIVTGMNAKLAKMALDASGTEPLVGDTFNAFLPKLGISYHWSDDITTSFIAQKGYRSGGVGTNVAKSTSHTYDPEYTKNYELSFRSVWLDGSLSFNANVFYVDWQDQQIKVQLSTNQYDTETKNAGSSTVKGFETELFYQPTNEWSIYAGVGKSLTNFDEFKVVLPTETHDLSGRQFAGAPEWTANIGTTYQSDSGFIVNVNANYVDSSLAIVNPYTQDVELTDSRYDPNNDSRIVVNTRIGYQWDQIGIFVTGKNLFDEKYVSRADTGSGIQTTGSPRHFALRLEANF